MHQYSRVVDGVVDQTQPYFEPGFVECPADVEPGWLYDGTAFTAPPPPPEPVPPTITKLQAKHALVGAGLYDQFKAALDGANVDTKENYNLANELYRSDPLVVQFGTALGLDDSALDDLFRAAARM